MATISLIIPIFNEADHLERFLTLIDGLKLPVEKELVFVEDCSRDSSFDILSSFKFKSKFKILKHETNRGKGAALRTGIDAASGDIIGVQDADFEYDPNEIPSLVQPLLDGRADAVFGSRFKANSVQVHRTLHYLVNRFLTVMSNLMSGLYLSDMETCYKFFQADIIKNMVLTSDRFGFEPEVTAKVGKLKVRVMELPISYFPRNYIEGKKITWMDGIAALRHIVYYCLFQGIKESFKPALPEKYIPKGSNWL